MNKLLTLSRMVLLLGIILAIIFALCGDIDAGALVFIASLIISAFLYGMEN